MVTLAFAAYALFRGTAFGCAYASAAVACSWFIGVFCVALILGAAFLALPLHADLALLLALHILFTPGVSGFARHSPKGDTHKAYAAQKTRGFIHASRVCQKTSSIKALQPLIVSVNMVTPQTSFNAQKVGAMQSTPQGIGWIEVVCGPMFSGKTEELIRRVRRALYARQKVQIFKPG